MTVSAGSTAGGHTWPTLGVHFKLQVEAAGRGGVARALSSGRHTAGLYPKVLGHREALCSSDRCCYVECFVLPWRWYNPAPANSDHDHLSFSHSTPLGCIFLEPPQKNREWNLLGIQSVFVEWIHVHQLL